MSHDRIIFNMGGPHTWQYGLYIETRLCLKPRAKMGCVFHELFRDFESRSAWDEWGLWEFAYLSEGLGLQVVFVAMWAHGTLLNYQVTITKVHDAK